uniref:uncharacterized protein LOC120342896 isoform X1 n=1 Tax=Styela clava TaxID=7725 RepID=UPI0019393489|nr:uncharacterized protein LOC120342896 isoform X1 [Styela clava]
MQGRITIYSTSGCPHCKAAKAKLGDLKLEYVDVNLDDNPDFRSKMIEITGKRTVPQIFFNNIHVGGNDDFQKLTEEELNKLTNEVKTNPVPTDAPPIPQSSNSKSGTNASASLQSEIDENANLIQDFKNSGIIKDQRQMLTVYRNVFSGSDFVSFIMENKKTDRKQAAEMAANLYRLHFLSNVHAGDAFNDDSTLYRLLQDEPSNALNANVSVDVKPLPASELAVLLRKQILKLYGEFLSSDGKCVDYDGIKESDLFKEFGNLTGQLQRVNLDNMSREEKLAFFINIYNALVIHGNVEVGFPSSTWQRYKFFNCVSYRIGGLNYSLQDIENGILRSNRKGVGMLTKPFSKSDARLKVALDKHEPLIHFALVCGAKSCPPIKTYSSDGIMDELKCSAESFLETEDGCELDTKKKIVKLSKILDWYKVDFGENTGKVVEWVCECLPKCEKKDQLTKMIGDKNYKVQYMPYDWGANKKPKSGL